jgi:steroid 5-alpha reductase family enzyme
MTAAHPAPAAPIQKTGFLRNIAGTVITLPVAALVAYYTDLQFYALVIFGIQWVGALAYAVPFQDEHYLDVTGSATYAGVVLLALFKADAPTWRSYLLTAFVILWCVRLGYFLIKRIGEQGSDSRFDAIRVTPVRFFSVWNIQGLWVFLTLLPTLLTIVHGNKDTAVEWVDIVGIVFWVIGFYLEVTADRQKTAFRHNPANKGKFIHTGLWAYSRHPNYLGEILIWLSVYAIAYHVLPTTQYKALAALGPLFIILLLSTVSGIPVLEKQADERWGHLPEYQSYKARTSVLLLWPAKKTKNHGEYAPLVSKA